MALSWSNGGQSCGTEITAADIDTITPVSSVSALLIVVRLDKALVLGLVLVGEG